MTRSSKKKRKHKPRPMARTRREVAPPVWAVVGAMLVLALGLGAWVWRPVSQSPAPEEPVAQTWKAGPEDVVAFADTMAVQARQILVSLGVPPEVIRLVRLEDHPGSRLRWEVRSEVPGDLPLVVCNLALTRLAQRLGGSVLEGREDRLGTALSLRIGHGNQSTALITLRKNPALARRGGRIAIIIDDFGYQDRELIEAFCRLPHPITLSIFPHEEHTEFAAQQAIAHGKGVMVHLPMEPLDFPGRDPGPRAIFTEYAVERIRALTREALQAVPGAQGMNNHMGSRVTENAAAIGVVLQEVKRRDLFFIDSMTSPRSVAFDVAQAAGIPSARNGMFLDLDESVEAVVNRLYRLAERARNEGTAIGIGHAKPNTLSALKQVLPQLGKEGFEFVTAEKAVR